MKKLLIAIVSLVIISGCSSEPKETVKKVPEVSQKNNEPTQDELNEKLKSEAVRADFVELNGGKAEMNKRVFAVGEVTIVIKEGSMGEFTLTTVDGDGYGMYTVKNVLGTEVNEGDQVKVYGPFTGKDDLGFPTISATIIEKQ